MWGKNKDVIRNVRIDSELNDRIMEIAKAEKRTISNTIQLLLSEAVYVHLRMHPKTLETINADIELSIVNDTEKSEIPKK